MHLFTNISTFSAFPILFEESEQSNTREEKQYIGSCPLDGFYVHSGTFLLNMKSSHHKISGKEKILLNSYLFHKSFSFKTSFLPDPIFSQHFYLLKAPGYYADGVAW